MKVRAFITHKQLEEISDCQDRFRVNSGTKSIALSDGMGQSVFQDIWADILCKHFVNNPGWLASHESIVPLCPEWKEASTKFVESQSSSPFSYLLKNALYSGKSAGATFVGIRIENGHLKYNIQGDSSLVRVTGCKISSLDDIISSQKGAFDSYPDYFDSNPTTPGRGDNTNNGEIALNIGDIFLAVSDPFSDFFYDNVSNNEDCHGLVSDILKLNTRDDYESLVNSWRNEKRMHNDDSTLIIMEYDGKDEFELGYIEDIDKWLAGDDGTPSVLEPTSENQGLLEPNYIVPSTEENNEAEQALLSQPNDDEQYTKEIEALNKKIAQLEADKRKLQFEKNNNDKNYKAIISKKDKRIKSLESEVEQCKKELKERWFLKGIFNLK